MNNLKKLLDAMADQLEAHASLQDDQQPSHAWAEQLSSGAQALRDAASRVNPMIVVKAGEPD